MRERPSRPPRRPRVFLLSPARLDGPRALRLRGRPDRLAGAEREVGRALRSEAGVPLEALFATISGLYFRGKLAYARRFARPTEGAPGVYLITTDRGLVPEGTRVRVADVEAMADARPDPRLEGYRRPLLRTARRLDVAGGSDVDVVLLGSLATEKYVPPLQTVFGDRLLVPGPLAGRGSLERGSLLLRAAREGVELPCVPGSAALGPRDAWRATEPARESEERTG